MNRFAFMIHPLEVADVARKFPVARWLPEALVERAIRFLPPVKTSYITGVKSSYAETEGWFISCPLTTRHMLTLPEDYVLKKIIDTGRLAEKLGAQVLGLGAMTSVVGDGGITVARHLDIGVTTGNSLTVATAVDGTKAAARMMEIDLTRAQVAVIGATGSIGAICAQLLAREVGHLTLVARNQERLRDLAARIQRDTGLAASITADLKAAIHQADVIITVTSAMEAIIEPEDLKAGALVCDVARPRDVSRRVAELRDDVLVIEGGVMEAPGPADFHFNFGYPPGLCLACMAETMVLALEGRLDDYSLGRELRLEQVEEISALAAKHGFKLAGLRSFERPVTGEQIEAVKTRARRDGSPGA
ncbi:MAG: shikimate dehydrogenase [Clostridia bacterium]|nr:MAG: shikimate dehydrogenase [Clostridia bacterium]